MKENHSLALICAYYLSKFDQAAYKNLGYSSKKDTHESIGQILNVKPNSVKNMRDEFDPLHENHRAGWYQRPLSPSRVKVVEAFQDLSEEELRDIVLEIINNPLFSLSDDFDDIVSPISKRNRKRKGKTVYIIRGPTGRRAEKIFMDYHQNTQKPSPGKLRDRRDHGCGYDFEIEQQSKKIFVEVKGLDGESGGIVLTSKEWDVAKKFGDEYFLAIVRKVSDSPDIQIIQNPGKKLSPQKNVFMTVQVRWNISDRVLRRIREYKPLF
jgi:hypothetical protein